MPLCSYAHFWISVYRPRAYIKDVVNTHFLVVLIEPMRCFIVTCMLQHIWYAHRKVAGYYSLQQHSSWVFCIIIMFMIYEQAQAWGSSTNSAGRRWWGGQATVVATAGVSTGHLRMLHQPAALACWNEMKCIHDQDQEKIVGWCQHANSRWAWLMA
jgi:hypothetical protein